jgi:hypothetical protein
MHTTLGTTRLHLLLAAAAALTGTTYGVAVGVAVLLVIALRLAARELVAREGSAAVGARVLAPAQHTDVLDAARGPRHRLAG